MRSVGEGQESVGRQAGVREGSGAPAGVTRGRGGERGIKGDCPMLASGERGPWDHRGSTECWRTGRRRAFFVP